MSSNHTNELYQLCKLQHDIDHLKYENKKLEEDKKRLLSDNSCLKRQKKETNSRSKTSK